MVTCLHIKPPFDVQHTQSPHRFFTLLTARCANFAVTDYSYATGIMHLDALYNVMPYHRVGYAWKKTFQNYTIGLTTYAINSERTATNIRSISAIRAFDAATQGTLDNHIDRSTQNLLLLFIHSHLHSCWFPYGMLCRVVLSKYVYLNNNNTTQHSCEI